MGTMSMEERYSTSLEITRLLIEFRDARTTLAEKRKLVKDFAEGISFDCPQLIGAIEATVLEHHPRAKRKYASMD